MEKVKMGEENVDHICQGGCYMFDGGEEEADCRQDCYLMRKETLIQKFYTFCAREKDNPKYASLEFVRYLGNKALKRAQDAPTEELILVTLNLLKREQFSAPFQEEDVIKWASALRFAFVTESLYRAGIMIPEGNLPTEMSIFSEEWENSAWTMVVQ